MSITIYGKPGCVKCKTTHLQLPNAEYIEVDTADPQIEEFRKRGVRSMPVVEVRDEHNDLIDSWTDFNFERIRHYQNQKVQA